MSEEIKKDEPINDAQAEEMSAETENKEEVGISNETPDVPHIEPPLSDTEAEIIEEPKKKKGITDVKVLVFVVVVLAVITVALVFALALQPKDNSNSTSTTSNNTTNTEQAAENHVHDWETNMVTVEAPRLVEKIPHPAVPDIKEVKHTICNTCLQTIDNKIAEHYKETGHKTYTTDVPIAEEVVVQDAYVEEVVVQEYSSKTVENGEKCRTCGETRGDKPMSELLDSLGIKTHL